MYEFEYSNINTKGIPSSFLYSALQKRNTLLITINFIIYTPAAVFVG
jgi:hypothetical protein